MWKAETNPVSDSSEEDEGLDVKPLRTLSPVFQSPMGVGSFTPPNAQPVIYVSPYDPGQSSFPSGYPSSFPGAFPPFASPDPISSVPVPKASTRAKNGTIRSANTAQQKSRPNKRRGRPPGSRSRSLHTPPAVPAPENGSGASLRPSVTTSYGRKVRKPTSLGGISESSHEGGDDNVKRDKNYVKRPRLKPIKPEKINDLDTSFLSSSKDPRESYETVLMAFEALRRWLSQADEGTRARCPHLKASTILATNEFRVNMGKRLGLIPGAEIGDIFYFRIELCMIGLHTQTMAGIDYINDQNDTVAVSVVSSGGYENEEDDADVLVYSGSGGSMHDGKVNDQKLVKGNLALERSLLRDSSIRVIRSYKDLNLVSGKIYIYDGLYKVQESWNEKGKSGNKVFKYKLLRESGQPDGFATWKKTEKWKEEPSSRGGVILPDISSGVESLPVCLVNDVDGEKGPSTFQYATNVKYRRPLTSKIPLQGCTCLSVCLPDDRSCTCGRLNGGNLPYGSTGLLVSRKPMIYECNDFCHCSENCRNRVSQKGTKLQFEVFRTVDRGWGLRSWDPIRAGTFICEYTGEVIDDIGIDDDVEDNDYIFRANPLGTKTLKWNYGPELAGEPSTSADEVFKPVPIIINAKDMGNISRFMNHSCSPNVFWQPVQHDHGFEGRPHIMFFALVHIPPMRELTFDYGTSDPKFGRSKKCLCGSSKCQGVFG